MSKFSRFALSPLSIKLGTGVLVCLTIQGQEQRSVTQQPLYVASNRIWPSRSIAVCWGNATTANATERGWVRGTVEGAWEAVSTVHFTGWGSCSADAKGIRIRISDEGPHTEGLGKALDGKKPGMVLNFTFQNWGCTPLPCAFPYAGLSRQEFIEYIAVHEFGHALGFAHEQNRGDTPNWCSEEEQGSDGDTLYGQWDSNSVMNYCNSDWNGNGQLSETDISGVRYYYGASPWTGAGNRRLGWHLGDFNGDGKTDVFRQVNRWGGAEVLLSTGSVLSNPSLWTPAGHRGYGWVVGDFNGDGKSDLLRQVNNWGGAEIFLSTGTGFAAPTVWTPAGHRGYGWVVGDFDGDGKSDLLRQVDNWGGAEIFLSTGTGFAAPTVWTPAGHRGYGWVVGDFNGDGKSDLLRQVNSWGGAEIFLSTGTGFAAPTVWTPAGHKKNGWRVGDFNGDGKDDLLRVLGATDGSEVLLSTGTSFQSAGKWAVDIPRGKQWFVGFFNSDRKSDIMRQHDVYGGTEVFVSSGSGFAASIPPKPSTP